jgi:DNA-binding response OmpR family regulator
LADIAGRAGMVCRVEGNSDLLWETENSENPDAVVIDLSSLEISEARRAVGQCRERKVPAVAAVPREQVAQYDPTLNPDELLICPVSDDEFTLRVKQAVFRVNGPSGSQTLSIGDLSIDLERYEVSVAGRRVTLTYKEFQLLALLASNPGRVYTREALLSQVWGYDYLGGTRTVDVHVRRLRSKVESPGRSFVETIWNVGYRFKATG